MNTSSNNSNRTDRYPFFFFRSASRCILFAAFVLIVAGYALMAGPGSTAQSFCPDIFSTRRIVIAPMLCLVGYLLVVVGIIQKK